MPFAEISLILLGGLMVSIHTQWITDDGVTFLEQTGLHLGTELQTGNSLSNQGLLTSSTGTNGFKQASFRQQLQPVPLRSLIASRIFLRSIPTVDPELLGPNEGIGHDSPFHTSSSRTNGVSQASFLQQLQSVPLQFNTASSKSQTVDPELLEPNEGIGHDSPLQIVLDPKLLGPNEGIGHNSSLQFQNAFTTGIGVSSRTVFSSSRDNPQSSPFSLFGTISPFRGHTDEVFHITENLALPLITYNQFNSLPKLGRRGDAVVLTGGYINSLKPGPRRRGPGLQLGSTVWPLTPTVPKRFNHLRMIGINGNAVTTTREYINILARRPRRRIGPKLQFGQDT